MNDNTTAFIATAAGLVSAYVSNNHVQAGELPGLLTSVHGALVGLAQPAPAPEAPAEPLSAAQVKKSITDDGLVSFIDGKPYQTLKRHLTRHGLTPEQYRARFGLPANYPMTAPAYGARRSELAKAMGLGQIGRGAQVQQQAAE